MLDQNGGTIPATGKGAFIANGAKLLSRAVIFDRV
jgi:hypothetical protein